MARVKKHIPVKPVLLIGCEGTSTEYEYLKSWGESESVKEIYERVDVYPDEDEERPKTTPFELLKKVEQLALESGADDVWIVFDRDNHPKLSETFLNAGKVNIRIAFSSRSFEEWVVLHFEKNDMTFNATECKDHDDKPVNCGSVENPNCSPISCLTGHIRREKFIINYAKKKTFDLFSAIKHRTEHAIVNAAWLRFTIGASLHNKRPVLQTLNPYCDVDQLILGMQDKKDKIEWGTANSDISINTWTINVVRIANSIIAKLSHSSDQAVPINDFFPQPSFFTTDDELIDTSLLIVSRRYVINNNNSRANILYEGDVLEFTLTSTQQPYFHFNHPQSNTKIYIVL